jgi:hypothetical protein
VNFGRDIFVVAHSSTAYRVFLRRNGLQMHAMPRVVNKSQVLNAITGSVFIFLDAYHTTEQGKYFRSLVRHRTDLISTKEFR